ncbi:hypothetical protein MUU48_13835 [Scandinavium sp. H11S7]|uniref:hypothetical protein n=1 Tax=Scandinavium hiltneri TaxID=2926519 RepID=UPI002166417E|nr:hypothetical protein [Scandinavium hiltneri]MCS2157985.1 hypothetical protein [Scandinavium hiltneri]
MDGAKDLARKMLNVINVDDSGFLGAVAKGFISLPVDLIYLGRDFIDADHRKENLDDKFRIAQLIKYTPLNKKTIEKVLNVFIDDFISKIDLRSLGVKMGGNSVGGMFFSQWTGIKLGYVISERAMTALFAGTLIGSLLTIGAESSRAIYTARYLCEENPKAYYKLKDMGDLDLLYFLVEDTVEPFEQACQIAEYDKEEFDDICKYFIGGL